jgi:succinate dehydrogenase/fumarate reductase cytochrome b subunit
MEQGRQIYRAPFIEPILIGLLLVQVISGGALVWRWSVSSLDTFRVIQIASGTYLAFFIITHLNSALVSARYLRGIETDWAWASGAPKGLLLDAWNIRLLPHYAFGAFFIVAHLVSGLRQVLMAHGLAPKRANRMWTVGVVLGAAVSTAIILALCGARL